jgi:hypothetical protein
MIFKMKNVNVSIATVLPTIIAGQVITKLITKT